ncbi:hypothetical protein KY285_028887 [Solanum tuberosum]|nr:hypothetical protein KY285_028887 [Solanum tuberosum]KAH0670535.1 hypothetical protein KY289_025028 [Solanum tuberosum]
MLHPSSINFSIPLPEESPSTPVCTVGETGESITPLTEVVVSPELPFGEILPCSPTLVLSCDKSQNSEAQSVVKPSVEPTTEEVEVASRAVSSIMSERLFEGDLAEGRGPESNILATGAELVAIQSLASLRGDVQPTRLEPNEEEKEEPPLRWSRTGVRGANTLTVGVPDREIIKNAPKVYHIVQSTEFEKERQRKGKGKLVESRSKADKKRYGTRSEI